MQRYVLTALSIGVGAAVIVIIAISLGAFSAMVGGSLPFPGNSRLCGRRAVCLAGDVDRTFRFGWTGLVCYRCFADRPEGSRVWVPLFDDIGAFSDTRIVWFSF